MTLAELTRRYLQADEETKKLCKFILEADAETQERIDPIINEWMQIPEKDRTRERLEIALEPYL